MEGPSLEEWTQHYDEDEGIYFWYHSKSRKSTYVFPFKDEILSWSKHYDDDAGVDFWYNEGKQISTYEAPSVLNYDVS